MNETPAAHASRLSQFVLGCAQLGGLGHRMSDNEAIETLEAAWDCGVRAFDTAPHYGAGLSERRLGEFLSTKPRDEFTISTKVGRLLIPTDADVEGAADFYGGDRNRRILDYSSGGVLRSLDESLERLGLDHVDTVYVHDPDSPSDLDQAIQEALPELVSLRDQGVVSHVGAGMNFSEPLTRVVLETQVDQIMAAGRVTLLDRGGEQDLLPACRGRGIGLVAAAVFNSGVLADPLPGATFDYGHVSEEILSRAVAIRDVCRQFGVPLRAAAMQYPLRLPGVVSIAVGCRGRLQVEDNLAMLEFPIPDSLWEVVSDLNG